MKKNYLIGLGGSGGKIITQLYKRLIEERGMSFDSDVTCIAIDTDREELDALAQLGVKKIRISGEGSVGDYFNSLGGDVDEWCPNTENEGVFFASSVFNGASQCRLKSRLCLANYLKNNNNELASVLEESLMVSPTDTDDEDTPPIVLIASSIAGGTGSGIFIQTALYVKAFFRRHNVDNVIIHGLFACPDLYTSVVNKQQVNNLYANAYAVIRELNAFNLICGPYETTPYGGKLDINIEISTDCEGKLFEKDSKGRYGDKPYDMMYFVDKVNCLSRVLGGLPEYYKAMADMAYSHLYTDISGAVWTKESNELTAHNRAPGAIYGSAGAASIKYPYEDVLRYFAARSVKESIDSVWSELDRQWANHYSEKDAEARASGLSSYTPEPDERADHYVDDFDKTVKTTGASKNQFSFLAPMVKVDDVSVVDTLFKSIKSNAASEIRTDNRIKKAKEECGLADIATAKADLLSNIDSYSSSETDEGLFYTVEQIDESLDEYCKKCILAVADMSISFSNKIYCDDKTISATYDKTPFGIINGLLYNDKKKEWVHPVAARYLLYRFKKELSKKIRSLIADVDTPADDVDDFYNHLVNSIVASQRTTLSTNDEDTLPNAQILQSMIKHIIFGKKSAKKGVEAYFEELESKLETADDTFTEALLYFSYIRVSARLNALIEEYESFFDNIDEFSRKAEGAVSALESMHDNSRGDVYVCASAEVKRLMYEKAGRSIDTQTGETASRVSEALFSALRAKASAAVAAGKKKKAVSRKETIAGMEALFDKVASIVAESAKANPEIQSLDKNAFAAMLYEYELTYPEFINDVKDYHESPAAKNRIDQFINGKMKALATMSAPSLVYDAYDPYAGIYGIDDGNDANAHVSNSYRFISHGSEVESSIKSLIGAAGAAGSVTDYYTERSAALPKDTEGQTVTITYVNSDKVDPYTILCYSTVHCLQPYQISAFNELKGGVYYENYAKRISEMEELQLYSMTPHLDKRWHKHGVMPYINVAKEIERRSDLAKAFLFALCYGKIGYDKEGSDTRYVYKDQNLGRQAELIFFKGRSIPYNRINRVLSWFADHENLIELYSSKFDMKVEDELEALTEYSDSIGEYKRAITNYARILNQLKRNVIRSIEVTSAKNGGIKKSEEESCIGIVELAWNLHVSEENETDKDHGELLIELLCSLIRRYSEKPFNSDDIKKKSEGSEGYMSYVDVRTHVAKAFMESFAKSVVGKLVKNSRLAEEEGDTESMTVEEASSSAPARTFFGRDDSDLEEEAEKNALPTIDFGLDKSVMGDKRIVWAQALFSKYLND